jgi:hypothetical protein
MFITMDKDSENSERRRWSNTSILRVGNVFIAPNESSRYASLQVERRVSRNTSARTPNDSIGYVTRFQEFFEKLLSMSIQDEPEYEPPTRPRKKRRQSTGKKASLNENRLFVPFRALGLVTNHVPFVLQTRSYKGATDGPQMHILTCLGKSWAMWEGKKMTLLFVSACFRICGFYAWIMIEL